jgi:AcrR family transcriptional regulator
MPFTTAAYPRDQILQAAAELFFERGFAATGMNAIGERIGVSGPAIYTHFKSKDEILATLALDSVESLLHRIGPPLDDPWADLEHLTRNHVDEILSDRQLVSTFATEGKSLGPALREPIVQRLDQYRARWVAAVERCWPEHEHNRLVSAANAAMGIAFSIVLWPEEALASRALDDLLVAMTLQACAVLDHPGDGSDARRS